MKDYVEERAVEIASYIIEIKATVRQTAKKFGISKSTVHMVMIKRQLSLTRGGLSFCKKKLCAMREYSCTVKKLKLKQEIDHLHHTIPN